GRRTVGRGAAPRRGVHAVARGQAGRPARAAAPRKLRACKGVGRTKSPGETMAIRYRNRERRLERTISRIDAARRAIDRYTKAASEHEAWWRRHGRTLDTWRRAIAQRQRRQPTDRPAIAAGRFTRWTAGLRWH